MSKTRVPIDVSSHFIEPVLGQETARIDWVAFFGNANPVEVEIGSGKGLFLVNAARQEPGHNFLGIEIARKYAKLAAGRLARNQIANAKIWPGDAKILLDRLVPDQSLHAVHIYFPDPWWKSRHKKRRVFNEALVVELERILASGGWLNLATDVEEYYGVMRELVDAHPRFTEQPLLDLRDPEHELDYLTNFERKYRLEGRPVYRANYLFR
jgi:tRNA (guanine-N7-)-methyltransferase